MGSLHRPNRMPLLVAMTGICLYAGLLSRQYDQNGIIEAMGVEQGGASLFNPNHLLYRPAGFLLYNGARTLGYDGPSIYALQLLTALLAAVAVAFLFAAVLHLSRRLLSGLAATAFLGTSWGFWAFSTDAYYITPAAMFAAWALAITLRPGLTYRGATGIAVLISLAVLTWQANVFLAPALMVIVLWAQREQPPRRRALLSLLIGGGSATLTLLAYLLIGALVLQHRSPAAFLGWIFNYGGAHLPIWGQADLGRLTPAAVSAVSSFVPVWEGLGLRGLLRGEFASVNLPGLLSLLGFVMLILLTLVRLFQGRQTLASGPLPYLLLGYACYLPFLVWWDPFEPKWFVLPNLFLAAALAYVWRGAPLRGWWSASLIACVALTGFGTFASTIWPRYSQPNSMLQQAGCIAGATDTSDLIITTDWRWNMYLGYFFERQVFDTIHESGVAEPSTSVLARLEAQIGYAHTNGGQAYIPDLGQYDQNQADWLTAQTGLAVAELMAFPAQPAFHCEGVRFLELLPPDLALRPAVLAP